LRIRPGGMDGFVAGLRIRPGGMDGFTPVWPNDSLP
jgi:hypothetical protein